jgi:hypothetical protein
VDYCYQTTRRGVLVYAYANNHYAGYAPKMIDQFRTIWNARNLPKIAEPKALPVKRTLFD